MMIENVAGRLRAAAERIRRGWVQGSLYYDGRVCAVGAIVDADQRLCDVFNFTDLPADLQLAIREVARLLKLPHSNASRTSVASITTWNDADGQTAENVAASLEYAALLFEQEQAQRRGDERSDQPDRQSQVNPNPQTVGV